jgi:DNA-directed RNA polymerase subunit RPC12/RpoP
MPQSGESVCRFWPADHEVSRLGVVNGRRQTVKVRTKGYLVLTTNRVVFIQERGVFGKSYHLDFDVPLEGIGGLSMGGLMMKYVSLSGPGGENVLHVRGVASDAEFAAFSGLVQGQLRSRQKAIEAEKRRERVQIVLDFGFLKDYMSKGGLSMQVVKCPACGAPMSLPSEGSQVKCTHCGSTIFAQDIMEKVKELIG